MRRLAAALLLCLSVPGAPDVSGVWTGEMQQKADDGRTAHQAMVFRLKQAGDEITGTAGPDAAHQSAIRDAKLVADHLTFSVTGADESGKAGAGLHGSSI